jgi:nitrate/TMAO reductase-like tetraheme cytochrome c subunit
MPFSLAKGLFRAFSQNLVTLVGAALTTISASLVVGFLILDLIGFEGGPYLGILVFGLVPALLVVGLLLIPLGNFLSRRRRRKAAERGEAPPEPLTIDLRDRRVRWLAIFVVVMTVVNVSILAGGTYKAVEVMESTAFCGTSCHVMKPEQATHARSPHARVACTSCHVGPGASWFVKSKVSGTRQLFAVLFDRVQRPIETPVHNLRPARDTCEQCHAPERASGDRLKVLTHFTDDEKTEARKTVLLMKLGEWKEGKATGIHWHAAPGTRLRFLADPKRQKVVRVELSDPAGVVTRRWQRDAPVPDGYRWRDMDCVDCHNRPAHEAGVPEDEIDRALQSGRIDAGLPFIRREAVRIVKASYASHEAARAEIPAALATFYGPELAKTKADAIRKSGDAIAAIYAANVFPEMKIAWGTYRSLANHDDDGGCFRCHDGKLADDKGQTISKECDGLCHTPIATEAKKPEILDILYPTD